MPTYTDQLGRHITINDSPKRIVSLVPSQTELLYYLGLDEQIVGITHFCIHPSNKPKHVVKIGGTKNINIDDILELKPDLVIANKEENERTQIEVLAQKNPVWVSDIHTFDDALEMISQLGIITKTTYKAQTLTTLLQTEFQQLKVAQTPIPVAYLIWYNPLMTISTNTYINNILEKANFKNVFGDKGERYPTISTNELIEKQPQVLMLSSEPYHFKESHVKQFSELLPDTIVTLVDGEMFSWYGSRLSKTPTYLNNLIKNFDLKHWI